MKKFLTLCIVLILCSFLNTAFAETSFSVDNLITEIEANKVEQEVKDVLNAAKITDLESESILLLLGYKISENLAPYLLVGNRNIELERNAIFYDGNDLALGVGVRGDALELPENVMISYDIRYSGVEVDSTNTSSLLQIEQRALEASLIASKKIDISSKIKSVTPYVGYKITELDMNIKDACSETNYDADLNSIITGCAVEITDNISASVGASFGDEEGINAKVGYNF